MIAGVIGASNEAIHTIEEAKKQGVRVIAFDGNPDAEGLSVADKAVVVDITNEEATIEAVRRGSAALSHMGTTKEEQWRKG